MSQTIRIDEKTVEVDGKVYVEQECPKTWADAFAEKDNIFSSIERTGVPAVLINKEYKCSAETRVLLEFLIKETEQGGLWSTEEGATAIVYFGRVPTYNEAKAFIKRYKQ